MAGFSIRDAGALGRGMFADGDIPAEAVLWRDPVFIFPLSETDILETTALRDYYFVIEGTAFMCLGKGTLVNHADDPTADCDLDAGELVFKSVRPIKAGEQITIDYGWKEYPWASKTIVVDESACQAPCGA